eukprot:Sdes_comp18240_c0_seq3m7851
MVESEIVQPNTRRSGLRGGDREKSRAGLKDARNDPKTNLLTEDNSSKGPARTASARAKRGFQRVSSSSEEGENELRSERSSEGDVLPIEPVASAGSKRYKTQRSTDSSSTCPSQEEASGKPSCSKYQVMMKQVNSQKSRAQAYLHYLSIMSHDLDGLMAGHSFVGKTKEEYETEIIIPLHQQIRSLFARIEEWQDYAQNESEHLLLKINRHKNKQT